MPGDEEGDVATVDLEDEDKVVLPPDDTREYSGIIARKVAARICHTKRKQDLIAGIFGRRGRGKSTLSLAMARAIDAEIRKTLGLPPQEWNVRLRCTFGLEGFMEGYDDVQDPGVLIAEQWNVMMDARESMHALHQMVNHTVEMSRPYRQALLINMPIARMVDRNISSLLDVVVEVTKYLGWARWYEYDTDPLEGLHIAGRRRRARIQYPRITIEGESYTIGGQGDMPGNLYFEPPPEECTAIYDEKRAAFVETIRFETRQAAKWGKRVRVAEMIDLVNRDLLDDGSEDEMVLALDKMFPHRETKDWDVRRVMRILHPPAPS